MKSRELLNLVGHFLDTELSIMDKNNLSVKEANDIQIEFTYLKYLVEIQLEGLSENIESKIDKREDKKEFKKNLSFDSRIRSNSIEKSVKDTNKAYEAHTTKDLQVWILVHLFRIRKENFDLSENNKMILFIDSFIENYKESLSYEDIIRHQSGFARIATNLRFSVNLLQRIGLISKDDDLKLSYFGYVVFFHIWDKKKEILSKGLEKCQKYERFDNESLDLRIIDGITDFEDTLKKYSYQNKTPKYTKIYPNPKEKVERLVQEFKPFTESMEKFIEQAIEKVESR